MLLDLGDQGIDHCPGNSLNTVLTIERKKLLKVKDFLSCLPC